ncbi:hypothetical protein M405DRAFT_819928 [Rhizopogon salebrosus TDB-379]|nr:hypothetical protein M405DRAFT_819928 [Rhizopogon salebrosus TDB-379]
MPYGRIGTGFPFILQACFARLPFALLPQTLVFACIVSEMSLPCEQSTFFLSENRTVCSWGEHSQAPGT